MANAIINILECNNSIIRLIVTEGDNPLSRVTIFTNGVERAFWTSPPLNNEKRYNWQPSHFNEGLNEIRVNARDNKGNIVSEFRYIIKGLDENSNLKQLISENNNIKDDLVTLKNNLENNLIDKGVDVLKTDKILDLINKVDKIELGRKWARGSTSRSRQITGLSFRPSLVVFKIQTNATNIFLVGVSSTVSNFAVDYITPDYDLSSYFDATGMPFRNLVTVTDDGFIVDVSPIITAKPVENHILNFSWIAYE